MPALKSESAHTQKKISPKHKLRQDQLAKYKSIGLCRASHRANIIEDRNYIEVGQDISKSSYFSHADSDEGILLLVVLTARHGY